MKTGIRIVIFCTFVQFANATIDVLDPKDCPVIGNTNSKKFHVPGGRSYAKMLLKNKNGDNRKCFKTETEALNENYSKAKR